jgi:hypothetical protein
MSFMRGGGKGSWCLFDVNVQFLSTDSEERERIYLEERRRKGWGSDF